MTHVTAQTILIVDDDVQNRKLLETLLRPEGYLTVTAANGEDALSVIGERAPDLILLDIMMPGIDGYQVAGILKAKPATAHIPIIMVTALVDRGTRLAGLNAGAEEFLTKPVDRTELWLRVRNLLRLKTLGDFQIQAQEEILRLNAGLEERVRQRTAQLQATNQARKAAQAQNEAKDHFLAMLGHELRNPLAAIAGATALLERSGPGKPGAERCIEIISRQNRHLNHIVNDLLDVSRLMAGKIELEKEPLDMADCVGKCVEALRATEGAAGYKIAVHASSVGFSGDVVRIEQILNNLLTNALKFSEPGGEVTVTVQEDAGKAVVTVQDAGVGMEPELLSRVFEPFVQGPAPANRLQSGLGIGLALVRQLVHLHGGDVKAASAGMNQGSLFSFWVPAIAAQLPENSGLVAGVPKQRKLVYVEDNADARATMAELLRMNGYEVIEVADGASTLSEVLAAQPDVVIMDIGLPDIDGYEVARRLRADPLTRFIPLIALTGYGQLRDKQAAALAGFNAHLVKPAASCEMVKTIEEVLAPDEVFKG